jgi:hypothetical protein
MVQGETRILNASDKLVEHLISSNIDHCVVDEGIAILESDAESLKQFDIPSIDNPTVDDSDGIGYEIDEDTWNTLKRVHSGDCEDLNDLHIEWLSESGLIVKTDSGRIILTEDAKTWISSEPQ